MWRGDFLKWTGSRSSAAATYPPWAPDGLDSAGAVSRAQSGASHILYGSADAAAALLLTLWEPAGAEGSAGAPPIAKTAARAAKVVIALQRR